MFATRKLTVAAVKMNARMASSIKNVGVVGLGLMGHGIVQIAAQAGFQVLAVEAGDAQLKVGMDRITGSLAKVMAKDLKNGKFKSEAESKAKYDEVMARISTTTSLADTKDCDLVVEAILENEKVKNDFWKTLGPLVKPEALFASNTSSLAITPMAEASGRPDKFVGLHFFNPVQIMKLVEVVRTKHTTDKAYNEVTQFSKDIGKTTVSCLDTPGFIVNRLLVPYMASAMHMVDRQEASVFDIDVSMINGAGHPMGPLHLADYVGLDTCFNILTGWSAAYPNDPTFRVPKCLAQKVLQGKMGRKSGSGFYNWEGDKRLGPV